MALELDHVVVAAGDLAAGAGWLEERLGIAPLPGGRHEFMATHNRLLRLGPGEYLELIAIDPAGQAPGRPRWFGLDQFAGAPCGVAFVLRSDDLDHDRPPGFPRPLDAQRGDLRWRITIPDSGRMPLQGLVPMLIQWDGGIHPAERLPDSGLRLSRIRLSHPDPAALCEALPPMADDRLEIAQGPTGMRFLIATPDGEAWL